MEVSLGRQWFLLSGGLLTGRAGTVSAVLRPVRDMMLPRGPSIMPNNGCYPFLDLIPLFLMVNR